MPSTNMVFFRRICTGNSVESTKACPRGCHSRRRVAQVRQDEMERVRSLHPGNRAHLNLRSIPRKVSLSAALSKRDAGSLIRGVRYCWGAGARRRQSYLTGPASHAELLPAEIKKLQQRTITHPEEYLYAEASDTPCLNAAQHGHERPGYTKAQKAFSRILLHNKTRSHAFNR